MACPPDTDTKRISRYYLYRRVRRLWAVARPRKGAFVVLAGSEASEKGCLKHYMEADPRFCYFVDNDAVAGLSNVQEEWPEAQTFRGDVVDAIQTISDDLAFVNFDFCGTVKDEYLECVTTAAPRIPTYGVVAYTFVRGRENALTPNWGLAEDLATKIMSKDPRYKSLKIRSPGWMDAVRFLGYGEILRQQLGKSFVQIYSMRYEGNGRQMGVLAMQNVPTHSKTQAWRRELENLQSYAEKIGYVDNTELRAHLRRIAMELTDTHQGKAVASILHLPASTLAAWQAHKTRGTYYSIQED